MELAIFKEPPPRPPPHKCKGKRGHEFKREQDVVYKNNWREEREGRNNVIYIIIVKKKRNLTKEAAEMAQWIGISG